MKDDNDQIIKDDKYEDIPNKTIDEDKGKKRGISGFLLLCVITTVGVMFALGLSFSAVKFMDSNETINTLISSLTGDDNQDKFIITYVENTSDTGDLEKNIKGKIYISSASFYNSTNGASGVVTYFGGLMIDTKTTFTSKDSTVTYKITLKNDSNISKTFDQLFYNVNGDVKYTLSGIKKGDIIGAGKSVDVYLTLEYTKDDSDFPKAIDSSSNFNFESNGGIVHIIEAELYKTTEDSEGKVLYYGGMMLTTSNTFKNKSGLITYKVTIKNESNETKKYNGLNYNTNGDLKYTVSGIEEGDYLSPGQTKTIYLIVEYIGNDELPKTIESSVSVDLSDFGVSTQENGIYLVNQFPTRDEIGKMFQGKNYVFTFSLLLGKKTLGSYYELTAVQSDDSTLNPSYVKLYLEKNGQGVDMSYRNNGRVKVFTEYTESENPGTVGRLIYKDTITEDDIKRGKIDFVMRMWVSEDVQITDSNAMDYFNKKFVARVNTYARLKK